MQYQPAKSKENHHPSPKYPLILLRPPLNHPNRIPTDSQRVRHTIQSFLRSLQDLFLLAQVPKHCSAALEVLVQGGVGVGHEGLFTESVRLASIVIWRGTEGKRGRRLLVSWVVCRGEEGGGGWKVLGIGVFGGRGVVRAAAEELGAGLCCLTIFAVFLEMIKRLSVVK